MAYEKINNYPSYKKPGVYSSGSIKELGLNNDDLEKFSLGNWNSITKNNKTCVTYWLNNLQNLKCENNYFLTLNPIYEINKKDIIKNVNFTHPYFNFTTTKLQKELNSLFSISIQRLMKKVSEYSRKAALFTLFEPVVAVLISGAFRTMQTRTPADLMATWC